MPIGGNPCGIIFDPQNHAPPLRAIRPLGQVSDAPLPAGDFVGELHEYYCPGCVALLQVDVFCPTLGDDALLHDIALAMVARAPQPA